MGQIISFLCKWLYPNSKDKTQHNDHIHQPNYQATTPIFLDNEVDIDRNQQEEKHCIVDIPNDVHPISGSNPSTATHENNDNDSNLATPPHIVVDLKSVIDEQVANKIRKRNKKKQVLEKNVASAIEQVPSVTKNIDVRKIGQYNSGQRILLVGEGDFSFSACLAVAFGTSVANITATSLNSEDFLIKNYEMFLTNKLELMSRGGMVLHDFDATKMVKHPLLTTMLFRIIFNFPHAGKFGHSDSELRLHKDLIRGFLRNAKKMIKEDGEIHITSKSNGFYLNWNIPKIGSDQGLQLIQEIKFKRSKYPGYNTKYGFRGDKNFDCTPSKTYKFSLYEK